jgi:hypothetical protein
VAADVSAFPGLLEAAVTAAPHPAAISLPAGFSLFPPVTPSPRLPIEAATERLLAEYLQLPRTRIRSLPAGPVFPIGWGIRDRDWPLVVPATRKLATVIRPLLIAAGSPSGRCSILAQVDQSNPDAFPSSLPVTGASSSKIAVTIVVDTLSTELTGAPATTSPFPAVFPGLRGVTDAFKAAARASGLAKHTAASRKAASESGIASVLDAASGTLVSVPALLTALLASCCATAAPGAVGAAAADPIADADTQTQPDNGEPSGTSVTDSLPDPVPEGIHLARTPVTPAAVRPSVITIEASFPNDPIRRAPIPDPAESRTDAVSVQVSTPMRAAASDFAHRMGMLDTTSTPAVPQLPVISASGSAMSPSRCASHSHPGLVAPKPISVQQPVDVSSSARASLPRVRLSGSDQPTRPPEAALPSQPHSPDVGAKRQHPAPGTVNLRRFGRQTRKAAPSKTDGSFQIAGTTIAADQPWYSGAATAAKFQVDDASSSELQKEAESQPSCRVKQFRHRYCVNCVP